jgi:hypothetical protein
MSASKEKKSVNLSMSKELIKLMKIDCIQEDTDLSERTESLYATFLKSKGVKTPALKKKNKKTEASGRFIRDHEPAPK